MFFSNSPNPLRSRLQEIWNTLATSSTKETIGELSAFLTTLIYPAFCLCCEEKLLRAHLMLCKECIGAIEWIDKKECCPYCSAPLSTQGFCAPCQKQKTFLEPHTSLFLNIGPLAALWAFFRSHQDESLAKLFAAFCAFRLLTHLPWPFPQVIVPLPEPRIEVWSYRRHKSFLIAKALGKLLSIPVCLALVRRGNDQLGAKSHCRAICDQKVLLLSGEVSSSASLALARSCLQELFPMSIYSLALIDSRGFLKV